MVLTLAFDEPTSYDSQIDARRYHLDGVRDMATLATSTNSRCCERGSVGDDGLVGQL